MTKNPLELFPSLIMAATDVDRRDDAEMIAETIIEEQGAVDALLLLAGFAELLHQSPEASLKQIAMQIQTGPIDTSKMLDREFGLDLINILESGDGNGNYPAEAEAIMAKYDVRPGSAGIIRMLAMTSELLVTAVMLQWSLKRTPEAAMRFARAYARASLLGQDVPNPADVEWDG